MWAWILSLGVGLLTGILSGFGIGGGSLLMLYLTLATSMDQYTAGGVNLMYFLCCAPAALISHIKHKLVDWKVMLWCTGAGVVTSLGAAYVASLIDVAWLRRGFGALLLVIGVRELFCKAEKKEKGSPS